MLFFGVIVQILIKGIGLLFKVSDMVKVYYCGMFINGIEFDSFYKCGQLILFLLNCVILCWIEGVQKIQVGGKVKLMCLVVIVYGECGVFGMILFNFMLNFEVELLGIGG